MLLHHTNIVSSFWTVLFCWGHEQLLRALEWFPARQMSSVPVFDTELGKWREDRVVPPMVLGLVSLTLRGLHSLSAFYDLQWTQDVYARQTYYEIFRLTFKVVLPKAFSANFGSHPTHHHPCLPIVALKLEVHGSSVESFKRPVAKLVGCLAWSSYSSGCMCWHGTWTVARQPSGWWWLMHIPRLFINSFFWLHRT